LGKHLLSVVEVAVSNFNEKLIVVPPVVTFAGWTSYSYVIISNYSKLLYHHVDVDHCDGFCSTPLIGLLAIE